jgi:hypothetical protein
MPLLLQPGLLGMRLQLCASLRLLPCLPFCLLLCLPLCLLAVRLGLVYTISACCCRCVGICPTRWWCCCLLLPVLVLLLGQRRCVLLPAWAHDAPVPGAWLPAGLPGQAAAGGLASEAGAAGVGGQGRWACRAGLLWLLQGAVRAAGRLL